MYDRPVLPVSLRSLVRVPSVALGRRSTSILAVVGVAVVLGTPAAITSAILAFLLRRKIGAADTTGEFSDLITSEPGVGYRIREA